MIESLGRYVVSEVVRFAVYLPLAIGIVRFFVWAGFFEAFEFPNPTWMQTWGIAILVAAYYPPAGRTQ
jgi:hypothetical protein